ncbi:MAG: universal stress protein [Acidobacteriaceae bacterium]
MNNISAASDPGIGSQVRLGTTRVRFEHILVCTDFSPGAKAALDVAISLAKQFDASLLLVNAAAPLAYPIGIDPAMPELLEANLDGARARMKRLIARQPALRSIKHEGIVSYVGAVELINQLTREKSISLIVTGSHSAHGLEKLLLGSFAETVLRNAICPVLVVGPHCRRTPHPFRSIVFATGLRPDSQRPAQYASAIAEELNARLTLLHVAKKRPPIPGEAPELLEERLADSLRSLLPPDAELWCKPKVLVAFGDASNEVLNAAAAEAADLIVVGIHEPTPLADHAPWSTMSQIIHGATCPVLGVREHLG